MREEDEELEIEEEPEEEEGEEVEVEAGLDDSAYEDTDNLVHEYLKSEEKTKFLETMASEICEQCDKALENSSGMREERKKVFETIAGRTKRRNGHWDGCADMKTYLALERVHRLYSRLFVEIFVANRDVFRVNANSQDPDEIEAARLLTAHGNWQINEEITDFLKQQKRGLFEFIAQGTVFFKSSRDVLRNRNRHDVITYDKFIVPYVDTAVEIDLSDMPWKAEVLNYYAHELEDLEEKGTFANLDKVLSRTASHDDNPVEDSIREKFASLEGLMPDESDKNAPVFFLEYHGFWKLPGEKKRRPVCATVEPKTKSVVRLYVREEDDWKDRVRFEEQTAMLQRYRDAMGVFDQRQAEYQMQLEEYQMLGGIDPMGMPLPPPEEPVIIPPPPPKWAQFDELGGVMEPAPIRKVPMELYVRGDCIDNIHGFNSIGFGHILTSLQGIADTAINHFIDAADFGNSSMIVTSQDTLGKKDPEFGPGKVLRLQNVEPSQIKSAFEEVRPAGGNPQLLEIVRMAGDYGDSAIAAPAVLSGEPGKSGETYRGISTRIEQATRQLTTAGLSYLQPLTQIMKNNAKLNAMFMDEEEVFRVSGTARKIQRNLYIRDYSVSFTADVRFVGQQQRVAEVDALLQMAGGIPYLAQNPAYIYALVKDRLETSGKGDLVEKLGQEPPPPQVPFGTPPAPPPGVVPPGMPPGVPPQGGPPIPQQ
jgi:hypothetical protein